MKWPWRIEKIKPELEQNDEMRAGSISLQYRDAETKSYPYYQLNWVAGARKQSEYVSKKNLGAITRQTENYKHFKALCPEWVELGIERSKLSIKLEREPQKCASLERQVHRISDDCSDRETVVKLSNLELAVKTALNWRG